MFRNQYGIGCRSGVPKLRSAWQWQPTTTVHDPNPPIVLETPASGGVTGTLAVTLAALLLAGTGTVAVSGSGTPTLGPLTLAGTGTVPVAGSGAATLGSLTLSGTAGVAVSGAGSATLGTLTLSGTATVTSGGGPTTERRYYRGRARGDGAVALSEKIYYRDELV